jgi:ATP-dependent RNA helicase DDX51/DBP6
MDIKGVKHVVNYDCPPTARVYVHRAGRTARANEHGDVWTLIEHSEGRWFWKSIMNGMMRNNEVSRIKLDSPTDKK